MTFSNLPKTILGLAAATVLIPASAMAADTNASEFVVKSASNGNIRAAATAFEKGDFAKSAVFSQAALKGNMSDRKAAVAFTNLCAAEAALGDMDSAKEACDSALALRPGYEPAETNKAALTVRLAENK